MWHYAPRERNDSIVSRIANGVTYRGVRTEGKVHVNMSKRSDQTLLKAAVEGAKQRSRHIIPPVPTHESITLNPTCSFVAKATLRYIHQATKLGCGAWNVAERSLDSHSTQIITFDTGSRRSLAGDKGRLGGRCNVELAFCRGVGPNVRRTPPGSPASSPVGLQPSHLFIPSGHTYHEHAPCYFPSCMPPSRGIVAINPKKSPQRWNPPPAQRSQSR